ncbi:hypothetical protein CZ771_01910 [Actinomycetales bacterium JB111]|nr:hypothetical protein CZ771_01910 [Actinomycetales bacterium JB111]
MAARRGRDGLTDGAPRPGARPRAVGPDRAVRAHCPTTAL